MFVCIVAHEARGPVRIGIAKDPARHLAELQRGNPNGLRLAWAHEMLQAARVIAAARQALEPLRVRNDWYAVSPERAEQFVKTAALEVAGYTGAFRPGIPGQSETPPADPSAALRRAVRAVGEIPDARRDGHGYMVARKAMAAHLRHKEGLSPAQIAPLLNARPDMVERWLAAP